MIYQTVEEIIAERDDLRTELARLMEKHNALHVNAKALRTELQAAHKMSLNGVEWREEAEKLRAERDALRAWKEEAEKQEPVAWRTFDGEGGYDYRGVDGNEDYRDEFIERNPNHATWVEPLYARPVPAQSVPEVMKEASDHIIDFLQSQYDTEGITENDSGDALIRLSGAIAAVEEVLLAAALKPEVK